MDTVSVSDVALGLLRGTGLTLLLTAVGFGFGALVGLTLGLAASVGGVLATIVRIYSEVWRAVPLTVTLFVVFFGLPVVGIEVPVWVAVSVGLVFWCSANIAEIARGAFTSVPSAQRLAAFALGMSWWQATSRVIVPQAVRRMIPSSAGIFTELLHGTAIATALGAAELITAAGWQMEILSQFTSDSHSLTIMSIVLAIYFVLSLPVTMLARFAERRLAM